MARAEYVDRRWLLKASGMSLLLSAVGQPPAARAQSWVQPSDADWPSEAAWESLKRQVDGRLLRPVSPFKDCAGVSAGSCRDALAQLGNPFFISDEPALTQVSGWADAWTSEPSPYAVAAASTADVIAAVKFARQHRVRLAIRGGGHSYQGTSCAPASLLVWTRPMSALQLSDTFVGEGCDEATAQPAVSIGAGFNVVPTFRIDFGYQHAWFDTVKATGTETFPGSYDTHVDLFSLGIVWQTDLGMKHE